MKPSIKDSRVLKSELCPKIGLFFLFFLWVFPLLAQKAYNFRGSTRTSNNTDCYQITADRQGELGAIWYVDKLQLNRSFDLEFTMNFGGKDNEGADGMVFVIQTVSNQALGQFGQGIGYAGFSPSLGIEFDTWQNPDENDPTFDHIAIVKNGVVNHTSANSLARPVQALASTPNIEDGKDHNVRINWDAKRKHLEVYFDCERRVDLDIDLVKDVFLGRKDAWWGFTGATGGSSNNQTVCLKKDIVAKDTFQICAGETVELVARNSIDNKYQWSPRTFLNDADSRSPTAKPAKSQLFLVNYRDFCNEPTRDSIYVDVAQPSKLQLGGNRNVCLDQPFTLLKPTLTPDAPKAQFLWSSGDTTRNLSVTKSGKYVLNMTNGGCKASDSATITFRALPVLGTADRRALCLRDEPLLLDPAAAATAGETLRFLWKPTNQTTPSVEVSEANNYEIEVRNQYDCLSKRLFVVTDTCPPVLYIPTVFTPNNDGQNDVLLVQSPEKGDYQMLIYNRWGQALFETNDVNKSWDGNLNGVPCPVGSYVWKVIYQRPRRPLSQPFKTVGSVFLMR